VQKLSLIALGRQHLKLAKQAANGRSAETFYGGHERALRQTLIALAAGTVLKIQDGPDEATVQVQSGRIRLIVGQATWNGSPGDLLVVPAGQHSIEAVEDSVLVLTVSMTIQVR